MQNILGYTQWRRFENMIDKAKIACEQSKFIIDDYFGVNTKIVKTGVFTKTIIDYKFFRYACYLIAQNGEQRKEVITLAQTYFAIQTIS